MHLLKYAKPATFWEESLPLGNGRIGATVYGGMTREQIDLNEDTIWSGRPSSESGYRIPEEIETVRQLIREGKFAAATEKTDAMTGVHDTQSYQMAGSLYMDFSQSDSGTEYTRSLDLSSGIASTSFMSNGVTFTRDCFVSHPHQVMVMRLGADTAASISFRLSADSQMRHENSTDAAELTLEGQCPYCNHSRRPENIVERAQDSVGGMKYVTKARLVTTGGKCSQDNGALEVTNADEVLLMIAIKSGFVRWDKEPSDDTAAMEAYCDTLLDSAASLSWDELKEAHIEDHQSLYNRMSLDLGATDERYTDQILKTADNPEDNTAMINLVFNYGRYLMIASSRPGTQPANLQGIWNDKLVAPWRSNYTTNINLEMNYWPAETCNLSDCVEPLLTMVKELSVSGRRPARELYNARGWCLHHNCDIWRYPWTGGSKAQHAFWPVGGAWLCQHLYEHYLFSGNQEKLAELLPAMKDAAAFLIDFLVEGEDGRLTTNPSTSPENCFYEPGTKETASVCEGSAMDLIMIRELFENTLEASSILGDHEGLIEEIRATLEKLAMPKIGSDGRLLEFGIEVEETQPSHRHISHLYGVYPGSMFTPDRLSEYYAANRKSLEIRGDKSTGWAMAWRVAMWARFCEGNRALKVIGNILNYVDADPDVKRHGGGLLANLWGAHPPYQIDGNFGVTAGIAEMLLQSHRTTPGGEVIVELLPALPDAWKRGAVSGMRARGGLQVDFTWSDGRVVELSIYSTRDQALVLLCNKNERPLNIKSGESIKMQVP